MSFDSEERPAPQRRQALPIPTSVEDAQKMRAMLVGDIARMESDLADEARRDRMAGAEYLDWQRRVKRALTFKRRDITSINTYLHDHRAPSKDTATRHRERVGQYATAAQADPQVADDPVAILAALRGVILILMSEEVQLEDGETAVLGLASDYLRRHPRPALGWQP